MDDTRRTLAWRLNWYRQSELDGALLLGRLVRTATDTYLIERLTEHCADEARHSHIWVKAITGAGLPMVKIHRSYQSFYMEEGGLPSGMLEVLSFTQIFERRVHKQFMQEMENKDLPEVVKKAFDTMVEDEADHLSWVHDWLKGKPGASECLNKYQGMDAAVYEKILPYRERLWELPGLGEELEMTHE
jgi:hypothetical protein